MRRGEIRTAILLVLADAPRHGYEVMTELAERTGGMWRPSPGSVYPTLQQLEDEGLVRAEDVDGKRVFNLTDVGRAESEKLAERGAPWDEFNADVSAGDRGLHHSLHALVIAYKQVAKVGTPAQIAATQQALDGARKSIYRALAEDEPVEDEPADGTE